MCFFYLISISLFDSDVLMITSKANLIMIEFVYYILSPGGTSGVGVKVIGLVL